MTINEFKEKLSKVDYNTGAKKVLLGSALVVALMVAGTQIAHAAVPAQNIIGDAQLQEDRTRIKNDDAQDIFRKFYGFNKYGNQTITMTEIRQAIELSDVLNGYYFDAVEYTNTTKEEVLNLDISSIFNEYIIAISQGGNKLDQFCANHLEDKPAIDAYITFACGTVANNIEKSVATKVNNQIATEGQTMTLAPRTIVKNNQLFVLVEVEGQTQMIELTGEAAADIVTILNALNHHTDTALKNIAGASNEYENTFAYNGIDKYTNESVWLSFPDDNKQENIEIGIQTYDLLEAEIGYEVIQNDSYDVRTLTKEEKIMLRELGYDRVQVNDAVRREAYLGKVLDHPYTK